VTLDPIALCYSNFCLRFPFQESLSFADFAHIYFTKLHIGANFLDIPTSAQTRVKNCEISCSSSLLILLLYGECICAGVKRVYLCTHIQGGSDISGTISERHRCIKNSFFFKLITFLQSVSADGRSVNKNKQTHLGKDELTGSYNSHDSLCSTTGKPTHLFRTKCANLDSV
jgi:hypothetical protein